MKTTQHKKEYMKGYRSRPEVKQKAKEYRERNEKRFKEYRKEYNSRPEVRQRISKYEKERRNADKNFSIKRRIGNLLYWNLKQYSQIGKVKTSKKYGINFQAIIENLKPFPRDIKNYQIHHIIPLSWFNLNNQKEIKWAFAPENHRWATTEENSIIGNRFISPNFTT